MASLNEVTLIGRLGAAPDVKQGSNESLFGTMSVATNRKVKNDKGEIVDETEWHRVAISGQNAKFAAEYLEKGSPVVVKGSLRTRSYEGKDGATKYVTEIKAYNVQGLGVKSDS